MARRKTSNELSSLTSVAEETGVIFVVPVQCDLHAGLLTVDKPQLVVRPGDRVLWSFNGIPPGWWPAVTFAVDDQHPSAYGPFAALRQTSTTVWGEEPRSVTGTFLYRAQISRGYHPQWSSPLASLSSNAAQVIASEMPRKVRQVAVEATEDRLLVEPTNLKIYAGDVVTWHFYGLPQDLENRFYPLIRFTAFDPRNTGTQLSNLYFGPFESLAQGSFEWPDGQGATVEKTGVLGAGNNLVAGTYYYEAALVEIASGRVSWINSDPILDNRGEAAEPP